MKKYPFTFYVKSLPGGFHGKANGPIIRILKSKRGDKGLYVHELVHVKQFFRTAGLHMFLYRWSKKYRLKAEVEAYKYQLKEPTTHPMADILFASWICNTYGLDIKHFEALALLKK